MDQPPAHIEVRDLTLAYGEQVIQAGLSFRVEERGIFIVMGGNGCGKSTLLRHLLGLHRPHHGAVFYRGVDFWQARPEEQATIMRHCGILYQGGALWSSMTLAENVALPLEVHTDLSRQRIKEIVSYKLALVGLAGQENLCPAELSGGMRRRAGLARAMALDPEVLFFDEPSAGLDPINARRLDDLILELRESLGTTVVVVSHDLASIFAIGEDAVFLDTEARTMIARGNPKELRDHCSDPRVHAFLTRGTEAPASR